MSLVGFLLARFDDDETSVWQGECRCDDERFKRPDCPDRVLADCEMKRRIAGLLAEDWRISKEKLPAQLTAHDPLLLRLLALPYSDHPDYREEWRP